MYNQEREEKEKRKHKKRLMTNLFIYRKSIILLQHIYRKIKSLNERYNLYKL